MKVAIVKKLREISPSLKNLTDCQLTFSNCNDLSVHTINFIKNCLKYATNLNHFTLVYANTSKTESYVSENAVKNIGKGISWLKKLTNLEIGLEQFYPLDCQRIMSLADGIRKLKLNLKRKKKKKR